MKEELKKDQPYDKFLSLSKKEEDYKEDSIIKEESTKEEYSSEEMPTEEYVHTYYDDPYSFLNCVNENDYWNFLFIIYIYI